MERKAKKKKRSFVLLKQLVGGKSRGEKMDILQEEVLQSPVRTVLKNFASNKLAMFGLIVFLLIFAIVLVGPYFYPISLNDKEETQTNVGPGLTMMNVPEQLAKNVKEISAGSTFSVGVDNDGKVYVWGKTKISKSI